MAKKTRLSPNKLAEVKSSFAGLKTIKDYAPVKPEFAVGAIQPVEDEIDDLMERESQLLVQIADVRDLLADRGTFFAAKLTGAAQQVVAQYGDDSQEIQALGRKRKSERASNRPSPAKSDK